MTAAPAAELVGVNKTYPRPNPRAPAGAALRDLSMKVERGEFLMVKGPSGCGKSTLLNLIGTMDRATTGQITLFGQPIGRLTSNGRAELRNAKIGFVFQSFNLLPRFPVWRNVALPLLYAGVPVAQRRRRVGDALSRMGLDGFAHHKAQELSGGQQQRVALARALANDPLLLLADEPTGSLDQATGLEMMRLLAELNRNGLTILMVTHDNLLVRYANRVITMADGQIIEERNGES